MRHARRSSNLDPTTTLLAAAIVALLTIGGTGRAPSSDAAPPPAGRFAHGAAGTARNGFGGVIAPSATMASWPGTGAGGNGGPFAFIGAQYGSLWGIPAGPNNSMGVGYCVMEDVGGEGTVIAQPDPAVWDSGEMARAAALMATFGGDRVVPYGIDASGTYDIASGEWFQPTLFGGGEYTRRRQVAVNFGVKMFVEDVSPSGAVAGQKLARDTAVVNGSGGEHSALRNGYSMAQRMATIADTQHATGGLALRMVWGTPDARPPTAPGTYPLSVIATDSTGKPVGFVPVVQASDLGLDGARSDGATAVVDNSGDTIDDAVRWAAAEVAGWPTWDMAARMTDDRRFTVGWNSMAADVTDVDGVARFIVTIDGPDWELGFHTQAPTSDVTLHSGTGVQGQITWGGTPQSASVHEQSTTTGRFVIRKVLDATDVQGERDMSGFAFTVADTAGHEVGTFTTGSDGRTRAIEATPGEYRVSETTRPAWAAGTVDGGPVTFGFDPQRRMATDAIEAEIVYANAVPTASIRTSAVDAADGDRYLDLDLHLNLAANGTSDATVIDTISYTGLVPDTAYVASGELMRLPAADEDAAPTPTGISASTSFVPTDASGTVEATFTIPSDRADLVGTVLVAFERVSVGSSGRVVAEHLDPTDPAQTVRIPSISSDLRRAIPAPDPIGVEVVPDPDDPSATVFIASSTPSPPSGLGRQLIDIGGDTPEAVIDDVHYRGLAPGSRYRLDLTLHERSADGTCVATNDAVSLEFVAAAAHGTVEMPGIALSRHGVFVAFERLSVLSTAPGAIDTTIAVHDDCDDQRQTVWAPAVSTAVEHSDTIGAGTMTDTIAVSGLADGLPDGATLSVVGSLHRHDSDDRTGWMCTDANRIASFELTDVDPDEQLRSPGETHGEGWHSYEVHLVVASLDGTAWTSAPHGCRVEAESFIARPVVVEVAPPTDTITPTPAHAPTPPPTVAPPATLPRTGSTGAGRLIAAGIALLLLGAGAIITVTPGVRPQTSRSGRPHLPDGV